MRSKALYHLLLDRARHLRIHGGAPLRQFLEEVEDSMEADFAGGIYTISWRYRNETRSLKLASDVFTFYVPGDIDRQQLLRNVRQTNWLAALGVWRQVVIQSGEVWPDVPEDSPDSMGLDLAKTGFRTSRWLIANFAVMLLVGSVVGHFFLQDVGFIEAFACAAAGVSLAFLSRQRDGLRRAPWPPVINDWVILVFAITTPSFVPQDGLIFLAAVIVVLAGLQIIERFAASDPIAWIVAFAVLAAAIGAARSLGLSVGMFVFIGLWLFLTVLLPGRVHKPAVIAGCCLAVCGAIVGVASLDAVQMGPVGFPLAVTGLVLVFALLFGLGWFIGEMFVLGPWLIHGALGFVGLASLIVGDGQMAGAVMIATGFAVVEFVRMMTAFRGTKANSIVLH